MLLLHIGLWKTGSTTLQYFLNTNAAALADAGALYPTIGRGTLDSHAPLANALVRARHRRLPVVWRDLLNFLDEHGTRPVIVSSEFLGEELEPSDIMKLAESLAGRDVRVVAYVRDFARLVVSAYAQSTKRGDNLASFDSYFDAYIAEGRLGIFDMIAPWADAFGWERLRVRSLDRGSLLQGDLIRDFLSVADLSLEDLACVDPASMVPRNQSPGWKTLELSRAIFAIDPGLDRRQAVRADPAEADYFNAIQRVASIVGRHLRFEDRGRYLSATQRTICAGRYRAEAERFNAVLVGPPLPLSLPLPPEGEDAERPFLPDLLRIPRHDIESFIRAFRDRMPTHGLDEARAGALLTRLSARSEEAEPVSQGSAWRGWLRRVVHMRR
jgi:hypothetical protein